MKKRWEQLKIVSIARSYTLIIILRRYNIHINTQISNTSTIALANEALNGENKGAKTFW